jgi:lauroyl/myristoyl acyltransferase
MTAPAVPTAAPLGPAAPPAGGPVIRFWLALLFFLARRAPVVLQILRPLAVWVIVLTIPFIRHGTAANAARILGRRPGQAERLAFARGVVRSFYDFVVDAGRCSGLSVGEMRSGIESVQGHETYLALRRERLGAIFVTAHMGSYEIGLAALTEIEPAVHVVFKRDQGDWENLRAYLRQKLGVIEAPIDDGPSTLMSLKAALENDAVVVMQADRAWPGQKSCDVPVLHGHLRVPTGPVKLALLCNSPIVPVSAVRTSSGRFRVVMGEAIRAGDYETVASAAAALGAALGRFIAAAPTQWLVLRPAFVEDQPGGARDGRR